MRQSDTIFFKYLLVGLKRDSEERIHSFKSSHNAEADLNIETSTELSNYDNHPADIGTQLFDFEMNLALAGNEEEYIRQIERSLKKIDDGTYGTCEMCGKDIDKERLKVKPYAISCIECERKDEEESKLAKPRRPVEEEILFPAFGRKHLNLREDDEHEGMDQLNDLIKYGSSDSPQDMGGYWDYDEYYTNEIDKQGVVDDMDQISNETYKKQLP